MPRKKTSDKEDDQKTDTKDVAATTPADMLALFANVGQIAIAPVPPDAAATAVDLKDAKPVANLKLAGIDATPTDVTKKSRQGDCQS